MPAFLILFFRFLRTIWHGLKDPEFRSLFYRVAGFLPLGTWFYARVEGWSILDSLYFSVITPTTVGYGDFSPQTPSGKIFTCSTFWSGWVDLRLYLPPGRPYWHIQENR